MSKSETVTANQLRKNDVLSNGDKVEAVTTVNGNQVCYSTNRQSNVVINYDTFLSRIVRTEAEIDAELDADDDAFDAYCQENERRQLLSEDD